jgi:ribosomal protein S6--L-glutamate ligase
VKKIGIIGLPEGWSSNVLADAAAELSGRRILVDMATARLDLEAGSVSASGLDLMELDALIVKKIAPAYSPDALDRLEMLRFLELRGLPVFSRPSAILSLVDRLSCTVTLRAAGLPMPPTFVAEDVDAALAAVERFGRAVLKPLYSTKAKGMAVVEAGPDARAAVEAFRRAGNQVIYVQKLLPGLKRDLGVTFLGGRYLGAYARQAREGSWNTTTRSGGRYAPHEPGEAIVKLARKAQALFGLDFTCVDVAETPDGPVIFEVSAFGGFRGLKEACGVDAAALLARHVLESLG